MCNCLQEKKQEFRNHIRKTIEATTPVDSWENQGEFKNTKIVGNSKTPSVVIPFVYSYTRRKNNGEAERRITNAHVDISMIYCPFCGEKF